MGKQKDLEVVYDVEYITDDGYEKIEGIKSFNKANAEIDKVLVYYKGKEISLHCKCWGLDHRNNTKKLIFNKKLK